MYKLLSLLAGVNGFIKNTNHLVVMTETEDETVAEGEGILIGNFD